MLVWWDPGTYVRNCFVLAFGSDYLPKEMPFKGIWVRGNLESWDNVAYRSLEVCSFLRDEVE